MTTEAYIPRQVTFNGQPVAEVFALTLHDPDSDTPHGTLTTHNPLPERARGPLVVIGTREGTSWRVDLPEVEVYRQTSVGCEFNIFAPVTRKELPAEEGD